MQVLGGLVVLAILGGFLWLLFRAANTAWNSEQAYKAEEAAWMAAHPEDRPSVASRAVNVVIAIAGLGVVGWLTNVGHINVIPACLVVAIPVLIARHIRRTRRQQRADNARFHEPT